MRVIIERVTCDRCGQVFDFEKARPGVARIEPLTEWLNKLGWQVQPEPGSTIRGDEFCPNCVNH